jgi:hypothetical protein
MKNALLLAALFVLAPGYASADELLCASKKDQSLYVTTGQVRLRADIANPTLLERVSVSTTGSKQLGVLVGEVEGVNKGEYVRFEIGADAWCSYRLALPKNFMTREKTPAFLDAFCEENGKDSIRLDCAVL